VTDVLPIVRLGHPALRRVAEPVPEAALGTAELRRFAERMVRTMLEGRGVGLAAPQVGESLRLFAYWLPGDGGNPELEPRVLVNPVVRPVGSAREEDWEGCLSIPGLRGLVPRHVRVRVRALTVEGEPVSFVAERFHARVIQHEHDHLDGIVYLDRMRSLRSLAYEEEWERWVLPELESAGGGGARSTSTR